nr:thrombospondin type-1 domain-containing protein 1 [Anolis sagrei ordinatus]
MKQTLRDFSNLLLVVLCDYVLGAVEYLLLEQPTHVALSNGTVSVGFQSHDSGNVTLRNTSILLIDASTNQTVAEKPLPHSQYQDIVVFECFHFRSAGKYWLKMASEIINGTESQWSNKTISLSVIWPVFHFDLRRTSEGHRGSLQLQLFTNEYLCPLNNTVLSLDVILTSSLQKLGTLILNETVGLRTRRKLSLFRSQWVKFDCLLVAQEAYVAVLLKLPETNSVIASAEPVDLLHRFGYKLVVASAEETCETSVTVSVIPPPCISSSGRITVFKYHLGPFGQRAQKLHESIMNPKDNQVDFNCTLFDKGTHKYCFEFWQLNQVDSQPRAKECRLIHRSVVSWSLWQAWSPCSVTCGNGVRERTRECLASVATNKPSCVGKQQEMSPCSLEECSTTLSAPITPWHPKGQRTANNLVTVTGISVCLSVIFATILITLWRKLCRTQKCSTPMHCDSSNSAGFRKNSDEETICQERQLRDSFSEAEAPCSSLGGAPDVPLNLRRSLHVAQDGGSGSSVNESFQSNAHKIIPPIFSYRLAQQQLKEMKKKGLTETTKVYHVSQNPLTDTVSSENQEAAAANKFRIKSPFLEQPSGCPKFSTNRPYSNVDFTPSATEPIWSPCQSLIRRGVPKYLDSQGESWERSYSRNAQFRRTASFHETRKAKPFRKRSMSTLTPTQTPLYHCRTRMWDCVPEEHKPKSKAVNQNLIELELYRSTHVMSEEMMRGAQKPHKWEPPGEKPGPVSSRQLMFQVPHGADRPEWKRNKSSPFLNHSNTWEREPARLAPKDCPLRGGALSPTHCRRSKCQSFPSGPKYSFYDNTTFGLMESGQPKMDLPGYFGSSEEGEISTLSIENLVI